MYPKKIMAFSVSVVSRGPFLENLDNLLGKLFYIRNVYIEDQNFVGFES